MNPPRSTYHSIRFATHICCCALCLLLLLAVSVRAQDNPIVRDIEFRGLSRVSEEDAIEKLPLKVGDPLRQLQPGELMTSINESLNNLGLLALDLLVESEGVEDGVRLIVVVEETPILSEIRITGNENIDTDDIRDAIGLVSGEIIPVDANTQIKDAVTDLYREKGYTEADVQISRSPDPLLQGQDIITVHVNEGGKIKIKDMVINGNHAIGDFRLWLFLESKGSFLFFKNYFDEEAFENDLLKIRALYRSKGYLDVNVERGEFIYADDNSWVKPVVNVTEGPLFRVEDVVVQGHRIFSISEIEPIFEPLENRIYDGKKLQNALDELQRLYGDNGYIEAVFRTEERIDYEMNTVDLIVEIEENQRITVRNVVIRRQPHEYNLEWKWLDNLMNKISPPIKDEVVLKQVPLEPGGVYRTFEEMRAERNLRRLGLFQKVDVRPVVTGGAETERDVEVFIDELGQGSYIQAGVAFSEEPGAFVFASYNESNLFGEAKTLSIDAWVGTRIFRTSITYGDRFHQIKSDLLRRLFNSDEAELKTSLYYYTFDRDEYDETHGGGTITYGIERGEFVTDFYRFRLEHVTLDPDNPFIGDDFDNSYPVASVRYGRRWDTTDDLFFPTEGVSKWIGLEAGAADGPLVKLTADRAAYHQLNPKLVVALKQVGGLLPYDADEIGLSERFFLGGDRDMRGFDTRGAGPKDPADDDAATGGSLKVLLQQELRYRFNESFYGLAFVDVGTIGEDFLEFDSPRASAGVGVNFRIPRPLIYLSIEFANAFIDEDEDETRFVHFRLSPTQ